MLKNAKFLFAAYMLSKLIIAMDGNYNNIKYPDIEKNYIEHNHPDEALRSSINFINNIDNGLNEAIYLLQKNLNNSLVAELINSDIAVYKAEYKGDKSLSIPQKYYLSYWRMDQDIPHFGILIALYYILNPVVMAQEINSIAPKQIENAGLLKRKAEEPLDPRPTKRNQYTDIKEERLGILIKLIKEYFANKTRLKFKYLRETLNISGTRLWSYLEILQDVNNPLITEEEYNNIMRCKRYTEDVIKAVYEGMPLNELIEEFEFIDVDQLFYYLLYTCNLDESSLISLRKEAGRTERHGMKKHIISFLNDAYLQRNGVCFAQKKDLLDAFNKQYEFGKKLSPENLNNHMRKMIPGQDLSQEVLNFYDGSKNASYLKGKPKRQLKGI